MKVMNSDYQEPLLKRHELWPTPLYQKMLVDVEPLNKTLLNFILESHKDSNATSIGMFRGRKANFGLLKSNFEAISFLKDAIFTAAEELNRWALGDDAESVADSMIAEAWSVEYGVCGYHKLHAHPGSAWSGVYYVSVESVQAGSGQLQLIDPRIGASAQGSTSEKLAVCIDPRDGLIVAFPSWLYHWVTPVMSSVPRICIAFNIGFASSD